MEGKHALILVIVLFVVIAGSIGVISIGDNGNSDDDVENTGSRGNNTDASSSKTGQELLPSKGAKWILIMSENSTLVDGETGHNSDSLTFNVQDVNKLSIDMHIISELCVACGGSGYGEVTVIVSLPTGDIVHREFYTSTTDLNLLYDIPVKGEWQIIFDGIAYGSDYKVGYELDVFVIE